MSYADQSQEQRNTREMCSLEWVKISDCTDFLKKKRILCIFSNVWESVSQLEQKHLGSPVTEANLVCVLSSGNADGNFWLSLILTV